ncbi:MAG: hypothetical protein N4A44_04245 [Alphaproteobacteria bacterium]|jgi:hypothetical protein|nr:hypothetical protein [Alphaproteobacteria bacterium]
MSKFNITFFRDREEDKHSVFNFFQNSSPDGWIDRSVYYKLPLHIVKDMVDKKEGAKKQLFDFMDREYDIAEEIDFYRAAQNHNEKLWKGISTKFAKRVFEITDKELCEYKCHVSMHLTTSAWNEYATIRRNVMLLWEEQYMTAFEILLSHTFKFVRDYYSEEDVASAWDVWGFAEITASFIMRDSVLYDMFPDVKERDININWFKNTPYTCLVEHEDVFKGFWIGRKSFKDYVDRSVEYLKKNPIVF